MSPLSFATLFNLFYILIWVVLVLGVLGLGAYWPRLARFRNLMLAQWRPALVITLLAWVGFAVRGMVLNPYLLSLFCQLLLGFALARLVSGYEPLPVTQAVVHRSRGWLASLALMIGLSILAVPFMLVLGGIGASLGQALFREVRVPVEGSDLFPPSIPQTFFLLLSGAGIAEETPYRLAILSFILWLTRRPWLAVIGSAALFGAYHLSPINSFYLIWWQFPISQFLASTFTGILLGWLYLRRGFETAVLAHTFSDWIPYALTLALGGG